MKTIKFNTSDCGVEMQLNVLSSTHIKDSYLKGEQYQTDFFEIAVFKRGRGSVVLSGERIEITNHTVVFLAAFQKRQWHLDPVALDVKVLVFQEEFLNDFFSDKLFSYRLLYFYPANSLPRMVVSKLVIDKICVLLTEIKTELTNNKSDSVHLVRALLYYQLQHFNRDYAQVHQISIEKSLQLYAYQYKQLLEKHILTKQRITDYTTLMGISRITLNSAVKKQFNATATQLLKQRLLYAIKELLVYTDKTVTQIADDLHYSEPHHLLRFFKSQTGKTPGQFRLDYQNGNLS